MNKALGLIEALGLTTAVTALDAASKAADITLVRRKERREEKRN
ncbi:MAG: BMC domain-containing protein [Bacillota bacterium]|nr:BMC domain-containing protein [Bacillota bacterium]